ncbi:HAMP domain-containing histidine kinase [Brevibacillus agri]|uniref:sensor histidine kinase n=1 Tax=Brevibacillus agri TaxID=51101 RepID=UPI001C8DC7CD|nr:HAMP domain-containing sensor histidine kinase [Brevibacillus agri]MBY0051703.1 HAMP domain-containing histidine kinase [Brevibacillus agri]
MKRIWMKLALAFMAMGVGAVLITTWLAVKEMDEHFMMYANEVKSQHNEEISQVALASYRASQAWDQSAFLQLEAVSSVLGLHIALHDARGEKLGEWGQAPGAGREGEHDTHAEHAERATETIPLYDGGRKIGQLVISHDDENAYMALEAHFQWAHKNTALWTMAVLLVIVVVLCIPLARTMVRPVVQVSAAAQKVAQGDLQVRVPVPERQDEIAALVVAFNNLVTSLHEQEELRKRLTADIAHELRTPLNTLLAQTEGMIDGIWEATPKHLESTRAEVLRLIRLVNDLDQVIQVEAGALPMRREQVNLRDVAEEVSEAMHVAFARNQIRFQLEGPKDAWMTGDRQRIAQVVANLLANACKHTPPDGTICVTIEKAGGHVKLQVRDNGAGIAPDDLPHVFARFYRGDRSRARERGGAGLGLTIAKGIVEAHGGQIALESSLGKGTTVTVRFPGGDEART